MADANFGPYRSRCVANGLQKRHTYLSENLPDNTWTRSRLLRICVRRPGSICNPDAGALFGLWDGNKKGLNSYEMAHQILTGFHFVGIVEEMKKSMEVLADRLLQWGTMVYFDHNLKLNRSLDPGRPAWLTPEDEVGRRVLLASRNDGLLYDFFRKRLFESHRDLRKRRWLGFIPAATGAKEAFGDGWSAGAQSLINSVRLYRSKGSRPIEQPIAPAISSDLLELRAAGLVPPRKDGYLSFLSNPRDLPQRRSSDTFR